MNIASAIAELRNKSGMTQEELSDLLFVSRDLVCKWETGARRPDYKTIEKIAGIFGVPASAIADKNELVYKELGRCLPDNCTLGVDGLTALLNSFLKKLDTVTADIFVSRYYFMESTAEIAAGYNMKENHVRTTLSRTRKKFKKYVKEATDEKRENV